MNRTSGRPLDWQAGGSPRFSVMDDDERWRGAQLADAKIGVYWGKYGKAEKAKKAEKARHKEEDEV
jgi:hypothetical protein